ncbi:MAG TPA: tRNA pseudouridine(38-40) synthase TruA [Thermoleophilia bacterium]|nr:tRNA pseudouridine(38-40) synthase TruA [Thermoleophilia bacterium]
MVSAKSAAGAAAEPDYWRLDLAYDGTPFDGWARQPGRRTVQGELEAALATVLREPVRLGVAGRTDAGVHAEAQVVSFATRRALDPSRLTLALNALLPDEIAVTALSRAPAGFDARAATARTYRYRVWLPAARPVFERRYVWNVRGAVDTDLLAAAARLLVGRRDFSALTPSARFYRTCEREVTRAGWLLAAGGREARFEITAGSFLHHMVRVAVGSMVDVAQRRLSLSDFAAGIEGGRRGALGRTAPAQGLALVAVEYGTPGA